MITKEELIEKLEKMLAEEKSGVEEYKKLLEEADEVSPGEVADIIHDILEDETAHVEDLTEALSMLED
jgi:bacterioferritin (cytochrome b1)